MLSEAVYILLGDNITTDALQRAKHLLSQFYSSFAELYSQGSCGLNVHNAGCHLAYFVEQWGPVWAWSCFHFEDCNAMLLGNVHGTGNVVHKVLQVRYAQLLLRKMGSHLLGSEEGTSVERLVTPNCKLGGTPKQLQEGTLTSAMLQQLGVRTINDMQIVNRITYKGQKSYSSNYTRMNKRVCNTVLLAGGRYGFIKCFVVKSEVLNSEVYAVVSLLVAENDSVLRTLRGGKQLHAVSLDSNTNIIVSVEELVESLVYICTDENESAFVARAPNRHGYCILK